MITSAPAGINKNQWIAGMTNAEYHSLNVITSSKLKFLQATSPESYHKKYVLREAPVEPTKPAFLFGTLFHTYLFEPERFEKEVVIHNLSTTTKKYAQLIKNTLGESVEADLDGGYTNSAGDKFWFLHEEDHKAFIAMGCSARKTRAFQQAMKNGVVELTGVAQCPRTKLWLGVRGDIVSGPQHPLGFFLDGKTCLSVRQDKIKWGMAEYFYDIQAAHYLYVAELVDPSKRWDIFRFLHVQKVWPYECSVDVLGPESLQAAQKRHIELLDTLADCEREDYWKPLVPYDSVRCIELPSWRFQ